MISTSLFRPAVTLRAMARPCVTQVGSAERHGPSAPLEEDGQLLSGVHPQLDSAGRIGKGALLAVPHVQTARQQRSAVGAGAGQRYGAGVSGKRGGQRYGGER